ncbi:MAG: HDOD domain-containing protein [Chloroflexi bacterium]|nr:HDOD domain-containing protein [Chloroflexota bacterium]
MDALYRVRQFVSALRPANDPTAEAAALAALSPGERALFLRLPAPYRRHSLAVQARLRAAGQTDPELLTAALLHDVGKAEARIRLHHRVLGVLLRNLALPLLLWLARPATPGSWRYPFHVQRHHAALGARLATAAGTPAHTVALIARHHDGAGPDDDGTLRALRAADGAE